MAKLLASHSQNALCEMSKGKKAALGRRPMYPELEDRLAPWIEESRSQGLRVLFQLFCII